MTREQIISKINQEMLQLLREAKPKASFRLPGSAFQWFDGVKSCSENVPFFHYDPNLVAPGSIAREVLERYTTADKWPRCIRLLKRLDDAFDRLSAWINNLHLERNGKRL